MFAFNGAGICAIQRKVLITYVNILDGKSDTLINGNPLEDISILTRPEQCPAVIMKGGKIYENTAHRARR